MASKKNFLDCHSERSEESSRTFAALKTPRKSKWILRCAQNDKQKNPFSTLSETLRSRLHLEPITTRRHPGLPFEGDVEIFRMTETGFLGDAVQRPIGFREQGLHGMKLDGEFRLSRGVAEGGGESSLQIAP